MDTLVKLVVSIATDQGEAEVAKRGFALSVVKEYTQGHTGCERTLMWGDFANSVLINYSVRLPLYGTKARD